MKPTMSMADLLRAGGVIDEEEPMPPVAEQRARLQAFAAHYATCRGDPPFKKGDLLVARPEGILAQDGALYIVLEVNDTTTPSFDVGHAGTPSYGRYPDIRVGRLHEGTVITYWNESIEYDPYVGSEVDIPI